MGHRWRVLLATIRPDSTKLWVLRGNGDKTLIPEVEGNALPIAWTRVTPTTIPQFIYMFLSNQIGNWTSFFKMCPLKYFLLISWCSQVQVHTQLSLSICVDSCPSFDRKKTTKQLKVTTVSIHTDSITSLLLFSDPQAGRGSLIIREKPESDWQEAWGLLGKHPDACVCQELCVGFRKTMPSMNTRQVPYLPQRVYFQPWDFSTNGREDQTIHNWRYTQTINRKRRSTWLVARETQIKMRFSKSSTWHTGYILSCNGEGAWFGICPRSQIQTVVTLQLWEFNLTMSLLSDSRPPCLMISISLRKSHLSRLSSPLGSVLLASGDYVPSLYPNNTYIHNNTIIQEDRCVDQ